MEPESKKTEEKITNLFEDMNPHIHNQESYEKMIQNSDKLKVETKKELKKNNSTNFMGNLFLIGLI